MAHRTIVDRYRVTDRLGTGGGGVVWRAHDLELDRVVAIKEIELDREVGDDERARLRRRALREARAAARLEHPNVVSVFDVQSTDRSIFIVMAHVDAPSLKQILDADGPLDPERVATIGQDLLAALGAAHAAGVLHRDVKPSNLLVGDTRTQVTDFGIASVTGDTSSLTSTGQALGTPDYVSPEQVSDEPIGPATDLWGVGATLFEAVEGVPPFRRDQAVATIHAVVTAPPREMARAGPLEPLLQDLLAKRPEDRPDIADARARLQQVLDGRAAPRALTTAPMDVGPPAADGSGDPATTPRPADTPPPVSPSPAPRSHAASARSSGPPPPRTPPVPPPGGQALEPVHRRRGMRVMATVLLVLLVLLVAVRVAGI